MNIRHFLPLLLPALLPVTILAAAPASYTAQLAVVVQAREQRCSLLRDELRAQDARIEARIDAIVTALTSISDSKNSRTKVLRLKETTIDSLLKNLENFRKKRSVMIEELRKPTLQLTVDQKREAVEAYDSLIDKRVTQILALQASLPTHQDYERYNIHDGSGWGWGPTYTVNEDFKQNQRLMARTNGQNNRLEALLRQSLDRLDQQNRTLKTQGAPASEIAKNEALIVDRKKQLAALLIPAATPQGRQLSMKEAASLDAAIRKSTDDLRGEFTTLFAQYNNLLPELASLNAARAALAAASR